MLVENHGGPISAYGPQFSAEVQLFAADDYVVFYPNPRGSTGYGEAFADLLYHDYPGNDYHDVMAGVDAVIAAGGVHADSLYVTGGSAGGVMTAWMVGNTDRFRAAAVVKPVVNWISKTLVADNYYGYCRLSLPRPAMGEPDGVLARLADLGRRQREHADDGDGRDRRPPDAALGGSSALPRAPPA